MLQKIRAAQTRLQGQELGIIKGLIELGLDLSELHDVAGKEWRKYLEDLGFEERMANRYIEIANAWSRPGINDTDLARLPRDTIKLEKLGQLSVKQFRKIDADLDLNELARGEIKALVETFNPSQKLKGAKPKSESGDGNATVGTEGNVEKSQSKQSDDDRDAGGKPVGGEPVGHRGESAPVNNESDDPKSIASALIASAMAIVRVRDYGSQLAEIGRELRLQSTSQEARLVDVFAWAADLIGETDAAESTAAA